MSGKKEGGKKEGKEAPKKGSGKEERPGKVSAHPRQVAITMARRAAKRREERRRRVPHRSRQCARLAGFLTGLFFTRETSPAKQWQRPLPSPPAPVSPAFFASPSVFSTLKQKKKKNTESKKERRDAAKREESDVAAAASGIVASGKNVMVEMFQKKNCGWPDYVW